MYRYHKLRIASILVMLNTGSAALHAQALRQDASIPLRNWTAPPYWLPSQTEREAPGKSAAQIQFSANQVSNTALTFVAITPCRLVDTRGSGGGFNGNSPFSGPSIASGGTITIPVQLASGNTTPAPCGTIPSIAQAYSLNLTVVPHSGGAVNYVTMWPAAGTQPFVATLNDPQGAIAANAAIVPAGTPSGGISIYSNGPSVTDVVIDMNGFYTAPTDPNGNTALGAGTLSSNTTGNDNAASGFQALQNNTTGFENTASGWLALRSNTTGSSNTASGAAALGSNTTGASNTASGTSALDSNTAGCCNTAVGASALFANTVANYNVANGVNALQSNIAGCCNTAEGTFALMNVTSGTSNIALGYQAGSNVSGSGSNNIHIGNQGLAADSNAIKIGTQGTQTSAFVAGISGVGVSNGVPVVVNSNGQLGIATSSRRFKEQITDMGDTSSKLLQLRPVNFFYKPEYDDGSHLLQYGLIAEEVEKIYPEMVAYDADGQIMTVKYQMLAPMLLNEVQKQNAEIQSQREENRKLAERLAAVEAILASQPQTPPASAQ